MDPFEEPKGLGDKVRTFDAFPKTRVTYTTRSSKGGIITLLLVAACVWLAWGEIGAYVDGVSSQHFSVQPGEGHDMQINLDITVAMACDTIHINLQDASGDRILAGDVLQKHPASFDSGSTHRLSDNTKLYGHLNNYDSSNEIVRKAGKKSKFLKNRPTLKKGEVANSCRIWGSMTVNRVMGDFHITAKGHGYMEFGKHIDHDRFNFSHIINELSFGEFYPKLVNPLDGVSASTEEHFYKYQYFMSVVPTTYIARGHRLYTNQYSVTEQDRQTTPQSVPGIFFKFDIEPISLTIEDSRLPLLGFIVRLANIIGGVMVAGGWLYKASDGILSFIMPGRKKRSDSIIMNGRPMYVEDVSEGHF